MTRLLFFFFLRADATFSRAPAGGSQSEHGPKLASTKTPRVRHNLSARMRGTRGLGDLNRSIHPSIHPAPSAPLSASFSSVSVLVAAGARGRMNPIAWRRERGATDANIASSVTYILTAGTSRPQLSSRGRVKVPTCPFSSSSIPVGSSAAELFPALGRRPPAKVSHLFSLLQSAWLAGNTLRWAR